MDELKKIAPDAGSYVSESDFFEKKWQQSFWGPNYPQLAAVKKNMILKVSSLSITVLAAKDGVMTALPGWYEMNAQRS